MKTIPCWKRRWHGMPRIHVVVTRDNGTHWYPLLEVLCWIGTALLIGGTYALL